MGDLRKNQARLAELASFMLKREGYIPYFYDDNEGYVTIGIGTLVKTEEDARRIGRDPNVRFTFHNAPKSRATAEQVVADWRRVHAKPGWPEHAYSKVAELRIDEPSVNYLMMQEISRSADALYRYHPFLIDFDSRIAMAFVDTRYNPAGINPYISAETKPLWEALDPKSKSFNTEKAFALFELIWAARGGKNKARYHTRHLQRTQWFRDGLKAMGAPQAITSVAD
jgi:hypothetical protein